MGNNNSKVEHQQSQAVKVESGFMSKERSIRTFNRDMSMGSKSKEKAIGGKDYRISSGEAFKQSSYDPIAFDNKHHRRSKYRDVRKNKKHENSYDLLISNVNDFISSQYEEDNRIVEKLKMVDPESELWTTELELDTNDDYYDEKKSLQCCCISKDSNYIAVWSSTKVKILSTFNQLWQCEIEVEIGPRAHKHQVFFLPDSKYLVIVLGEEILVKSVHNGRTVRRILPKDPSDGSSVEIDVVQFKYYITDTDQKISETHTFWNRLPSGVILCDGYYFYIINLSMRITQEGDVIDETLTVLSIDNVSDLRGEFYIPYSPTEYITIDYPTVDGQIRGTRFRFWELETKQKTTTKLNLMDVLRNNGTEKADSLMTLVMKKEVVESSYRITVVDSNELSDGMTRIMMFDTQSKLYLMCNWDNLELQFDLVYEYNKLSSEYGEPNSLQTEGDGKYALIIEDFTTMRLWGKNEKGYQTIYKRKMESAIFSTLSFKLGYMAIREAKKISIYHFDLPVPQKLEILAIKVDKNTKLTHRSDQLTITHGGLIFSVNKNKLFIKYDKNLSFETFDLHEIQNKLLDGTASDIKLLDFKKITHTSNCVFVSQLTRISPPYPSDKDYPVANSLLVLVLDLKSMSNLYFKSFYLPSKNDQLPVLTISNTGRSVSLMSETEMVLVNTITQAEVKKQVKKRGRSILVRSKDYIVWDANDILNNSFKEETTFISYYELKEDGKYEETRIELGSTGTVFSMHKVSRNEKYVVFYSNTEFILFDVQRKDISSIDPEELPLNLSKPYIHFSEDETMLAVMTESKKAYLIETSDLSKKTCLGTFDMSPNALSFFFVHEMGVLAVQDSLLNQVTLFSISTNINNNPNSVETGRIPLPKNQIIVGARVTNESIVLILTSNNTPNHLYRLKRPLNNLKFLNTKLVREQLRKYSQTDDISLKKTIFDTMLNVISMNERQALVQHPIYTILLYHLNHPGSLSEYTKIIGGPDVIFTKHPMLQLFFLVNGKRESLISCVKLFEDNYDLYKQYPNIDQEAMIGLIMKYDKRLITNNYREDLFLKVLFEPYVEKFSGEIIKDTNAMVMFEADRREGALKSDIVRLSVEGLLRSDPKNISDINIYETLIPLDFATGSTFSRSLFETLENLSHDALKTKCKVIVYKKWNRIFYYALIYSIVFWSMNILLGVFLGFNTENKTMAIIVVVMNILFLLYEFKDMASNTIRYIKDPWNYFDLLIQIFSIVSCLMIMGKTESEMTLALNWIRVLVVTFIGVRSITWLRVFAPTRYLITMVLAVFQDFVPFLVILIAGIILFGYIWRLTPGLGPGDLQEPMDYYTAVQTPVNIIFGNAPEGEDNGDPFNGIKFTIIIIGNATLALVLLNFLIALIGGTFTRISDEKDLYDVKELLYIIRDVDGFLYGFRQLVYKYFPNKTQGHYLSLHRDQEDGSDMIVQLNKDISGMIDAHMESSMRDINRLQEFMKKEYKYTRDDVKREALMVRQLIDNLRQHLDNRIKDK